MKLKNVLNESSVFENHIYANLKRMSSELRNLSRFKSPQEAIKVIDKIIDYLEDMKTKMR